MADDCVVVRASGGLLSNSRFGKEGFFSVAAEFDRVYGGNVVCVVLRDRVVTAGVLSTSRLGRDGNVGFVSPPTTLGCVGARSCSLKPVAKALLTFFRTMRVNRVLILRRQ